MDFAEIINSHASGDFYRIGLNGSGYRPTQTFVGDVTAIGGLFRSQPLTPKKETSSGYISGPKSEEAPTDIAEMINDAAKKHGVPYLLLESIIWKESKFNPNAVNKGSGAMGLGQLMPKTAAWLGIKNPMDPRENLDGSSRYIKMMLEQQNNSIPLALAAYNAGPGNVRKYKGIPPFKETRDYVSKIVGRIKAKGGIVGYAL